MIARNVVVLPAQEGQDLARLQGERHAGDHRLRPIPRGDGGQLQQHQIAPPK
jgi:hypothetical protein